MCVVTTSVSNQKKKNNAFTILCEIYLELEDDKMNNNIHSLSSLETKSKKRSGLYVLCE